MIPHPESATILCSICPSSPQLQKRNEGKGLDGNGLIMELGVRVEMGKGTHGPQERGDLAGWAGGEPCN